MIFGTLDNAERTARMPVLNYEHPRSRHEGYLALKRALTATFATDACMHLESICCREEEKIIDNVPQLNVCMWDKKSAGTIEPNSIVLGYPRFIKELTDKSIILDKYIHNQIKSFSGDDIIIYFDNNLYIKETTTPLDENVIALAVVYYIAHLRGKLAEMTEHLKRIIAPVYNKTVYVPAPRANYECGSFITDDMRKEIDKNGQGVNIDEMMRQIAKNDEIIRRATDDIRTASENKKNLQADLELLMNNLRECPAMKCITYLMETLKDCVVDIKFNTSAKQIELTLETYLDNFDRKKAKAALENGDSWLYTKMLSCRNGDLPSEFTDMSMDNADYKKFLKVLYEKIFVTEELKYITRNTLVLSLYPFNYSFKGRNNGIPAWGFTNPHIFWYNCWSDAYSAINKAYTNKNYDVMHLYLRYAVQQVSLTGDIAPIRMFQEWYRALVKNNPNKCLVDKDGYAYSIKELFELQ